MSGEPEWMRNLTWEQVALFSIWTLALILVGLYVIERIVKHIEW